MASLRYIGQRLMDQVNQDLGDRDKFFELEHFMFHCATAYSKLFDEMYQQKKKDNNAETGFTNVEISPNWLIWEDLKVQKGEYDGEFFVETSNPIFYFNFSSYANGVNGMRKSTKFKECAKCPADLEFRKISLDEVKNTKMMPYTNLCYYYGRGNNIIEFLNRDPVQVQPQYIPATIQNYDQCNLSDSLIEDVIKMAFNLFMTAKHEMIIQTINDGNRNLVLQQQANPEVAKN